MSGKHQIDGGVKFDFAACVVVILVIFALQLRWRIAATMKAMYPLRTHLVKRKTVRNGYFWTLHPIPASRLALEPLRLACGAWRMTVFMAG
jgi:isoprenylcysteine carboxyl methyltransferase (ICMT) family protein YpbQ